MVLMMFLIPVQRATYIHISAQGHLQNDCAPGDISLSKHLVWGVPSSGALPFCCSVAISRHGQNGTVSQHGVVGLLEEGMKAVHS